MSTYLKIATLILCLLLNEKKSVLLFLCFINFPIQQEAKASVWTYVQLCLQSPSSSQNGN